MSSESRALTSHGTEVEKSRAVAEVMVAAELAARFPRDEQLAEHRMRVACARPSLAAVAEYALPRSGKAVTGPTVDLARELARIWGNLTYGVVEITRNTTQSELLAYCWDVEPGANVRSARTIIVLAPSRAAKGNPDKQLEQTNQNNSIAARALREMILGVLPTWFKEDAIEACKATRVGVEQKAIQSDSATPADGLRSKVDWAVRFFTDQGVTPTQVENWAGAELHLWTAETLARVGVLVRSLQKREITLVEAFPETRLTPDDIPGPPSGDLDLEPTEAEIAAAQAREAQSNDV